MSMISWVVGGFTELNSRHIKLLQTTNQIRMGCALSITCVKTVVSPIRTNLKWAIRRRNLPCMGRWPTSKRETIRFEEAIVDTSKEDGRPGIILLPGVNEIMQQVCILSGPWRWAFVDRVSSFCQEPSFPNHVGLYALPPPRPMHLVRWQCRVSLSQMRLWRLRTWWQASLRMYQSFGAQRYFNLTSG